jgi:hypothetical protein
VAQVQSSLCRPSSNCSKQAHESRLPITSTYRGPWHWSMSSCSTFMIVTDSETVWSYNRIRDCSMASMSFWMVSFFSCPLHLKIWVIWPQILRRHSIWTTDRILFIDWIRYIPYLNCCVSWIILAKGTTGCFVIAVTPKAAKCLSTQFHEKDVYKTYWAIVRGGSKSFARTSGVIKDPILYTNGKGKLNKAGKPSQTEWELIGSSVRRCYLLLSQLP